MEMSFDKLAFIYNSIGHVESPIAMIPSFLVLSFVDVTKPIFLEFFLFCHQLYYYMLTFQEQEPMD